jgi:hypothetical protein
MAETDNRSVRIRTTYSDRRMLPDPCILSPCRSTGTQQSLRVPLLERLQVDQAAAERFVKHFLNRFFGRYSDPREDVITLGYMAGAYCIASHYGQVNAATMLPCGPDDAMIYLLDEYPDLVFWNCEFHFVDPAFQLLILLSLS